MDEVGDGAVCEGGEEGVTGDAGAESGIDFGSGFGVGDEPHLGFGLAVEPGCEVFRGMDLEAEILAGVEDFHEEREAGGGMGGQGRAEEVLAMTGPEVVERETEEMGGAGADEALGFGAVNDVPGFAEGSGGVREGAVEEGVEAASAPDALLGEGVEREEGSHGRLARCWTQMRDQLSSESRPATSSSRGWKARS